LLFFLQGLRYLIGALYSRVASAAIVATIQTTNPEAIPQLSELPGFVLPNVVAQEIQLVVYMAVLPVIALLVGRYRALCLIAALLTAVGRTLMLADTGITPAAAAAVTVGGGLLYTATLARHRLSVFATSFILAFGADQLFRAAGNTLDISWSESFFPVQIGLTLGVLVLGVLNFTNSRPNPRQERDTERGMLTFSGGISLGAMLFLQVALLSTANAVVGRSGVAYPVMVPLLLGATLLPLAPPVRRAARGIIGLFDIAVRGWVWLLFIFLFLVLGTRFTGIISSVGFVGAQFTVSMLWWWLVRPQAEGERNLSGLWTLFAALVFALFITFD
ncbi:MAG: hypothetical protein AAF125_17445, partial [Chloroflexota bacterium]